MSLLPLRSKREREKKKRVHQTEDKRFSTQSTDERCKGRRKKKMEKARKCRDTTIGNGTSDGRKCAEKTDKRRRRRRG